MMSMVTLILLAVFITMLFTTQSNFEKAGYEALQSSLRFQSIQGVPGEPSQEGGRPSPISKVPTLLVKVNSDQEIQILSQHLRSLDEAEIEDIASLTLSKGMDFGKLEEYNLRYMVRSDKNEIWIAFTDSSMESIILRRFIWNSFLVGFGALMPFFFLSLFLSRWAIRPVERAWNQQKRFVADASHELKTPLTVIMANAELLSDQMSLENKLNQQRLENIREESHRMKTLIDQLLLLAKSDNSSSCPASVVSLSEIVNSSILLYESSFFEQGLHFDSQIEEGLQVVGNPDQLRQLCDILLDNAIKYTKPFGEIQVRLSLSSKKNVHLVVFNESTPISEKEYENIFQRFYRLDQSRSHQGGFGLGLSIAATIAKEHGGEIWLETPAKTGNEFHVSLPKHIDA
jgi:signal transduction histidine kinase